MSWVCVICKKNTNNFETVNGKRFPVHKTKCLEQLKAMSKKEF